MYIRGFEGSDAVARMPTSCRSPFRPAWPLLACLAVALLWPASQGWTGWAAIGGANRRLVVEAGPGWLGLTAGPIRRPNGTVVGPRTGIPPAMRVHWLTAADRAALAFPQIYPSPGEYRFYCPLWMLTISAGLFAAALVVSRLRRRPDRRAGQCPRCGYDLRATPERCPECGTVASAL
jgi:hypothetical protein